MRHRLRLPAFAAALAAAAALAGCAQQPANDQASEYSGVEADVAEVVDALSAAAIDGDAKEICNTLLAPTLADRLGDGGTDCQDAIEDQVSDANSGDIDVLSVDVQGDTATARVRSPFGEAGDVEQTMSFVRDGGAWRISELTPGPEPQA